MQREIKFRAWDIEHKEMTGWIELLADKENDWHGLFTGRYPKIELLQYTGLKDKNGKEIYEGDIIAHTDRPDICKARVYFEFGSFLCQDAHRRIGGQYVGVATLYDLVGDPLYEGEEIPKDGWVIIGNIYENPELLHPKDREKE